MKIRLLLISALFVLVASLGLNAQTHGIQNPAPTVINQFDSVYFDLAQSVSVGSVVEFPVYLRSDDQIFSLDFEFKYDHTQFEFDSILNMTSYMYTLSYYNPNDSVVRLTSYTLSQPYTNDTVLVKVYFTVLSGQLCSAGLTNVSALLNGDAAAQKVIECQFIGLPEVDPAGLVELFPNPASDFIYLKSEKKSEVRIMDCASRQVSRQLQLMPGVSEQLDLSGLSSGIYLVTFETETGTAVRKLVKN